MSGLYSDDLIAVLEEIWGIGWLSPGGPAEVKNVLEGHDIKGKTVLDIGCGAGGVDLELVRTHGAAYVTGIDVEDGVLARARQHVTAAGLQERIGLIKVAPGPLPFPPETFDVVFSKDSIVHIPDKHALMAEVARVLKPGGLFLASDWLIGHDRAPSDAMKAYIAAEGLDFGMASPARYKAAIEAAGLTVLKIESRSAWYAEEARRELAEIESTAFAGRLGQIGAEFIAHNAEIWRKMIPVLETGEHCPTHLAARKP
jgi:ubiquinone/menaquinone biosynthesis C-methylase UbiE